MSKLGMGTGTLSKVWFASSRSSGTTSIGWSSPRWLERGRFHQWFNASIRAEAPVLCGFLGGAYAAAAEGWSDTQIVANAMGVLRAMYGAAVPDPTGWQIPRWSGDPFSRGSYSFHKLGSNPAMRDTLAAPVGSRLFFAGEATEKNFFATVHGAYLSGQTGRPRRFWPSEAELVHGILERHIKAINMRPPPRLRPWPPPPRPLASHTDKPSTTRADCSMPPPGR